MARKKVKLAWIVNDSSRRASLKKRRLGLMKKVRELTILCDIDACLIVYNQNEVIPMVCPSHSVVQQLVARFQSLTELEKTKKMTKQDSYLVERLSKVEEQQTKQQMKNKEVEMSDLIRQIDENDQCLDQFNDMELQGLTWFVIDKMMAIRKRIEYLEQLPFAPTLRNPNLVLPPLRDDQTDQLGYGNTGVQGDHVKTPADPFMLNQLFVDMMNKNIHKSVSNTSMMGEMGLPNQPYEQGLLMHPLCGTSSAAGDIGIPTDVGPSHWNSRHLETEIGLSPFGFTGASGVGSAHGNSVGAGSSVDPFGTDLGLGSHQMTSHPFAGETMPSSSGLGGGHVGTADGVGLPLDGKTWPSDFFH